MVEDIYEARTKEIDRKVELRIAAVAIQNKFTLITGNTKHFANVPGLRLENWMIG
jgi:predicted nucleic acid-binding protein